MKRSEKIIGLQHVESAMLNSTERSTIKKSLSFFAQRNETFTHDITNDRFFINSWFPSFPGKAWDRLYRCIDTIAQEYRAIYQADIAVTGKCHCNCWHCFRSKYSHKALELSVIKSFISQAYELGVASVGITGGEPMLRSDIAEIIKYIPDGMEAQLYTTGCNINKAFIEEIKNSNLSRCIISLDHYRKEIVCAKRGYHAAYDDALRAIELLSNNNIYTTVSLCISDDLLLIEDINKYFEFVHKLGVNEVRIILPIPQGNLEGNNNRLPYLKAKQLLKIIKAEYGSRTDCPSILIFNEYESTKCFGCGAGANYITLNNDGNILPCVAVPLVFGNIRENSLSEIFEKMGTYFKGSGRTCLGRRVNSVMKKKQIDTSIMPLSYEISQTIASQCVVGAQRSGFYKDMCISEI